MNICPTALSMPTTPAAGHETHYAGRQIEGRDFVLVAR